MSAQWEPFVTAEQVADAFAKGLQVYFREAGKDWRRLMPVGSRPYAKDIARLHLLWGCKYRALVEGGEGGEGGAG